MICCDRVSYVADLVNNIRLARCGDFCKIIHESHNKLFETVNLGYFNLLMLPLSPSNQIILFYRQLLSISDRIKSVRPNS